MPSILDLLLGSQQQPAYNDPTTFDPNRFGGLLAPGQQQDPTQAFAQPAPQQGSASFGLLGPMMPQGTGLLAMRGDAPPIEGRSASAPVSLNIDGFQADNPSDVADPTKRADGSYKLDTDPAGHAWAQQNAAKYGLQADPNDPTVYRPLAAAAAPQGPQPNTSPPMMTMAPQPMSLGGSPASAPVDMTRGGAANPVAAPTANGPDQRAPDGTGTNVLGTPASGTTDASSPGLPGFLDKASKVIGGLYGAGGPGDALIALGLSKMTDGASVQVLNSMNAARMQQSQQALLNLQANQKLMGYAGNLQAVKKLYPNISDSEAAGYANSEAAMGEIRKRLNPSQQFTTSTDPDGTVWQTDTLTGQKKKLDESEDTYRQLTDPAERAKYGIGPDDRGGYQLNTSTNELKPMSGGGTTINNATSKTYAQAMTEAVQNQHQGLIDGVSAAQGRARDIAAMQGALARIQANGGTTGIGAEEKAKLQSAINTGASTLGFSQPFDVDDAQLLSKFNRQLAGGQAKDVAGARVTNFEMNNFLQSNAGLALDPNANKRLLGIQSQIEERNISLGNQLRQNAAEALANGRVPNIAENEKLIRAYDEAHHIQDPITGQDLTKNAKLMDLQNPPQRQDGTPAQGPSGNPGWSFGARR